MGIEYLKVNNNNNKGRKQNKNNKRQKPKKKNQVIVLKQSSVVRNPPKRRNRTSRRMPQVQLQSCTLKYARAVFNPFDPDAYGACLPMGNFRPSQKSHSKIFLSVTIGSAGVGYFLYAPCLANDATSIFTTASTYTGTTTTGAATTGTGINASNFTTQPFTAGQLLESDTPNVRNPVQGRIVSCGVRWRYTGTELNRGGTVLSYVDPLHETLEGQSYNNIGAYIESNFSTPGTNHMSESLSVFSCNFRECNYPDTTVDSSSTLDSLSCTYPYSDQVGTIFNANVGAPIAGVFFTGVPGNTFLFEIIQHCEYEGSLCQSMLTPNSSDPQGAELVQAAASRAQSVTTENARDYTKVAWEQLGALASMAKPIAVDVAQMALKTTVRYMAGRNRGLRGTGNNLLL